MKVGRNERNKEGWKEGRKKGRKIRKRRNGSKGRKE